MGIAEGIIGLLIAIFSSGQLINFIVKLMNRLLDRIDENKELEKEWLIFTARLNRKIPVVACEDQEKMLREIEEERRLKKEEEEKTKEQLNIYKIENEVLKSKHEEVYKKWLKVEDKENFKEQL